MQRTPEKNLITMFQNRVYRLDARDFLGHKQNDNWSWLSWSEVSELVEHIGQGIIALGIDQGSKIAIAAENSPYWVISDLAILSSACVSVPIYSTSTAKQMSFIINHSEAKVIFVSHGLLTDELKNELSMLPCLKHIVVISDKKPLDETLKPPYMSFEELASKGTEVKSKSLFDRIGSIEPETLSTIMYTSGTTAQPKGVMLTHKNILSNCQANIKALPVRDNDVSLSFLPLSHAFERTAGLYTLLYAGTKIAYAESITKITANLAEINPSVFCCVPRVLEKVYNAVLDKIEQSPKLAQKLFHAGVNKGKQKKTSSILYRLSERIFFKKIRAKLGTNLEYIVSGGAALSPKVASFFSAIGIRILEGYGLTETSPVVCVNRPDSIRIGSVGPPIDKVSVKIAEDGEILVKGPNIMKGYYKDEESTQNVIDAEGYFHTGDIGQLDDDGHLKITDRKKEMIVTSGGKNVAPGPLENELQSFDLIEQACVLGDGQKYLAALIVPSMTALENRAKRESVNFTDTAELIETDNCRTWIQNIVDEVNASRASYETIKRFKLIPTEFSIEREEITPTLKLKRRIISKNYASDIQTLFTE